MGLGVSKHILQASKWYRKAAEWGNIDAQDHLNRVSALIAKENAERTATEIAKKEAEEPQWLKAYDDRSHLFFGRRQG